MSRTSQRRTRGNPQAVVRKLGNSTGRFGDANMEIDIYGGHRGKVTENLGYDIGMIRFLYPGSGGGWNGLTLKYAQGVSGVIKDFGRLSMGYSMPLGESCIGLTKHLGDGLSMGLQLSGTTHKADLGGAGDNRLVLSLIKGF